MKPQKARQRLNGRQYLVGLLCLLFFHAGCAARSSQPSQASIRWTADAADADKVAVEVTGLNGAALERVQQSNWEPAQWQRLLSVFAESGNAATNQNLPPMLGSYRVQSNVLRFEPQFSLEPGVSYRAVFHPDQLADQLPGAGDSTPVTAVFQLPPRGVTPTTVVRQIYPSADVLPENLLKFYVHFSAPMSRGRIYDHIHLRDATGKEIEVPFLEIDEELWDANATRLTLFIDPGRIKRGVKPLEDVGPALEAGRSYSLAIDREWRDGTGSPLKEAFQKVFKVGAADRDPPDPARWQIQSPKAETRDMLAVAFPEPMDHALAQRVILVAGESGQHVKGTITLETGERRWTFAPDSVWLRGRYNLVIQATLEDLAGNNIGKPFDVDLRKGDQRQSAATPFKLSFEVR